MWDYWSGFSAWVVAFWLLILVPLSYFVLTRPFDKLLPRGSGPEYDLWFLSVLIGRPMGFAFQIACPNYSSKHPIARINWGGYDFRDNASRFQIIFSYVYIYAIICIGVFTLSLLFHDFILN